MEAWSFTESDNNSVSLLAPNSIDHELSFPTINYNKYKTIFINLENVTSINSIGIKGWIDWLDSISNDIEIFYSHCPRPMINQINIVSGFMPKNVKIESFYVPYYCDACGTELKTLYEEGKKFTYQDTNIDIPKSITCDKCKADAEIDVTTAIYFNFLKR